MNFSLKAFKLYCFVFKFRFTTLDFFFLQKQQIRAAHEEAVIFSLCLYKQ